MRDLISRILLKLPINYYPYTSYMHKYKCIFIHIPKNAGSSVLACFGYAGSRTHAKWYDFRRANFQRFKQYHKFAIVREPLSRLYSSYQYCVQGGNQSAEDVALQNLIIQKSNDFDSFIINVLDFEMIACETPFQPQYFYIFDRQQRCMIDTLLSYEDLAGVWPKFAEKHHLPKALPWLNRSESVTDNEHLKISAEALCKVYALYEKDFTLLEFEKPTILPVE